MLAHIIITYWLSLHVPALPLIPDEMINLRLSRQNAFASMC